MAIVSGMYAEVSADRHSWKQSRNGTCAVLIHTVFIQRARLLFLAANMSQAAVQCQSASGILLLDVQGVAKMPGRSYAVEVVNQKVASM